MTALSTSKKGKHGKSSIEDEHGKKASMDKRENEATGGDGEVTKKTLERKKCNGAKNVCM